MSTTVPASDVMATSNLVKQHATERPSTLPHVDVIEIHNAMLFMPEGASSSNPVITCFPGGGFLKCDRAAMMPLCHGLVKLGFPVALVHYDLRHGRNGVLHGLVTSAAVAVHELQESLRSSGHTSRMIVLGFSAGSLPAFITGMGAQALVSNESFVPLAPMEGIINIAGNLDRVASRSRFDEVLLGNDEVSAEAARIVASPMTHLSAKTPPILSFYGGDDSLISRRGILNFNRRCLAYGIDHTLCLMPHQPHDILAEVPCDFIVDWVLSLGPQIRQSSTACSVAV
jgi:acetyl esterase/lipase